MAVTVAVPWLPDTIGRAEALAALDILGLPHTVKELTMTTAGLTVTLLPHDADGRIPAVGDGPVLLTVTIPIE